MSRLLLLFILSLTLTYVNIVNGHSHLAFPRPTRRLDCRLGKGPRRPCPGPCPVMDSYGAPTGITANNPSTTWRRGQTQSIFWHRNNHGNGESGFVRFSMVPVDKMMNKQVHEKYTFQVSCWGSGLHSCSSRKPEVCGNDAEGKAYRASIVVPTIYPDGVYAFGWAWFGGGDFRYRSFFGDYYSCSFVRIKGGAAVTTNWQAKFVPGKNTVYPDSCPSTATHLGVCPREPCNVGIVKRMKPRNFPRNINAWELTQGVCDAQGNGPAFCKSLTNSKPDTRPQPPPSQQKRPKTDPLSFEVQGMLVYNVFNGNSHDVGSKFQVKRRGFPKGFTLGLRASGRITKVKFSIVGTRWSHIEFEAPFIMNGNDGGRLFKLDACGTKQRKVTIEVTVAGIRFDKDYRFEMQCL